MKHVSSDKTKRGTAYIRLFQIGLVDDCLGDTGILEDVLTEIRVEFEDAVGGMALPARGGAGIGVTFGHASIVLPC